MFFIENGSEVEKNFMVYDSLNWIRYFYGKLKRRLLIRAFSRIGTTKVEVKLEWQDEDGMYKREYADQNFDTEEIVLTNIQRDQISNNCLLFFGQLLANGNSINEAKKIVCDKFCISELDFGSYMKKYMEKHSNSNFDLEVLNINDDNGIKRLEKK